MFNERWLWGNWSHRGCNSTCIRERTSARATYPSRTHAQGRWPSRISAPASKRHDRNEISCLIAGYVTLLDELVWENWDLLSHKQRLMAANGFLLRETTIPPLILGLLALRGERHIHASSRYFSYDSPRQLLFELGDHPRVFSDSWMIPHHPHTYYAQSSTLTGCHHPAS